MMNLRTIACILAMQVSQVLTDTIMPPTTGKFFYVDYMLNNDVGFHTVTIQLANGA
jgi:hypothetical protein